MHDRVSFVDEAKTVSGADKPGLVRFFEGDDELGANGAVGKDFFEVDVDVCVSTAGKGDVETDGREAAENRIFGERVVEQDVVSGSFEFDLRWLFWRGCSESFCLAVEIERQRFGFGRWVGSGREVCSSLWRWVCRIEDFGAEPRGARPVILDAFKVVVKEAT